MAMDSTFQLFRQKINRQWKYRLFLLLKLPSAFFSGLRLHSFEESTAVIKVRYSWFSQNPFRSMYFAVQFMAAEMSTGLLGFAHIYRRSPAVSMLVVRVEGEFTRKATGIIYFTCQDGTLIADTIEKAIATGEGQTIICRSVGTDEAGEQVGEFLVTWSFKAKSIKP